MEIGDEKASIDSTERPNVLGLPSVSLWSLLVLRLVWTLIEAGRKCPV